MPHGTRVGWRSSLRQRRRPKTDVSLDASVVLHCRQFGAAILAVPLRGQIHRPAVLALQRFRRLLVPVPLAGLRQDGRGSGGGGAHGARGAGRLGGHDRLKLRAARARGRWPRSLVVLGHGLDEGHLVLRGLALGRGSALGRGGCLSRTSASSSCSLSMSASIACSSSRTATSSARISLWTWLHCASSYSPTACRSSVSVSLSATLASLRCSSARWCCFCSIAWRALAACTFSSSMTASRRAS